MKLSWTGWPLGPPEGVEDEPEEIEELPPPPDDRMSLVEEIENQIGTQVTASLMEDFLKQVQGHKLQSSVLYLDPQNYADLKNLIVTTTRPDAAGPLISATTGGVEPVLGLRYKRRVRVEELIK